MIFPFVELPHIPGGWPRPVLDVVVGNRGEVLMPCLVDSGAMNTLLPSWIADLAGLDYTDATAKPSLSPVAAPKRGWRRRC